MPGLIRNVAISVCCAAFLTACGGGEQAPDEPLLEQLAPDGWADAAGGFINRNGQSVGYVAMVESPNGGLLLRIDLVGLSEGWHGIHLHQVGDCSDMADGFKASGGHINPDGFEHGLRNPNGPDRADLPNIYAGADGRATAEIFTALVTLFPSEIAGAPGGPHPIIDEDGFAVVVHENEDDHRTQPIGGAGPRVACAAILSDLQRVTRFGSVLCLSSIDDR